MKKRLQNPIFNVFLLLIIGVSVLFISLKNDFQGIVESLQSVDYQWLYFSFSLIVLYYWLGGYLLKVYTNLFKQDFSATQGFIICMIGAFGSSITPSSSGGQFFQISPYRKYGVKTSETASILWLDFIVYLICMISVVTLLFVLKFNDYFSQGEPIFVLVLMGFIVNVVILCVLLLLYRWNRFHYWITHTVIATLHKVKIVKRPEKLITSIDNQMEHFHRSSDILSTNKGVLIKAVCLNVTRLLVFYSIPYFVMMSLNIRLSISEWFDVIALTAFVIMVNAFIPIPGASGGTELTFVAVFSPLIGNTAVSVMLVWRFITFYFVMILGAIIFYNASQYRPERSI